MRCYCHSLFLAAVTFSSSADTITFDAVTLGGTNDPGTNVLTVAGSDGTLVTLTSSGPNSRNLFGNTLTGNALTGSNIPTVGIVGGSADDAVKGGDGEQMTVAFEAVARVFQITFTGLGANDDNLILAGIPSSPGTVTFATLGSATITNLSYSYDTSNSTLTVDFGTLGLSSGGTFAYGVQMTFEQPVSLQSFSFSADQGGDNAGGCGISAITYGLAVTLDTTHPQWQISPYLAGLHQVYCFTPDSAYTNGTIAAWAKRVGASTSRFPGGTVVKFWDWENPTGVLVGDPWDQGWNPTNNEPPSDWMSLDEYLAFVEASGIRPLFGVNSLSGQTYNREADSIARAVRMVKYVRDRGQGGALWYIGNEEESQYPDGITGYAQVFQRYAEAMKAEDPNILIFWNNNNATTTKIQTFLANDGGTADGLETHGKWPYGGDPGGYAPGTYEEWLVEVPLRDRKNSNRAWRDAANSYRQAAADAGRPGLLIADNEYGLGDSANVIGFNRYTKGLLLAEFLMEHFIGNWFSACFWDMTLTSERGLLDKANSYRFNPFHYAMNLLADAQGGEYLATVSTAIPSVHGFAARKAGVLLLYLLNKTTNSHPINVQLTGASYPAAFARQMRDSADGYGQLVSTAVAGQGAQFSATLPPLTFTEFVFADPGAFLRIQSIAHTNSTARLRWTSIPGALFDVEQSITLPPAWQTAETNIAPDNLWTESEVVIGTNSEVFFRVHLKP